MISIPATGTKFVAIALSAAGTLTAGTLAAGTRSADGRPPLHSQPIRMSLPAPTGHHRIGTVDLHLIDRSRPDPWVSSPSYRELMVSVTYPARRVRGHPVAKQMLPGAAAAFDQFNTTGIPAGVADWAATRTHAHVGAPVDKAHGPDPVILYSPGVGDPRTLGTVLTEDLASRGFVVVSIDPTYDAGAVEFPGGRVARSVLPAILRSGPPTPSLFKQVVGVRVADTRFVLDQLAGLNRGVSPDAEGTPLPKGMEGTLDLRHIGMFGQSGGGFTALQTMHDDPRLRAAVDLDGQLNYQSEDNDGGHPASVATDGLRRPFVLMGSKPGGHTDPQNRSWQTLWRSSRGWHRDLYLAGSGHGSFTDTEALVPQLARRVTLPSEALDGVGTVGTQRAFSAERAYLAAFFDRWLRGTDEPLLDGRSTRYPQLRLVGSRG